MLRQNRWYPAKDELATRVQVQDVRGGWLMRELIVEPGQQILISADGYQHPAGNPGSYVLRDIGDEVAHKLGVRHVERMTAALFSVAPFDLAFKVEKAYTSDPYCVSMSIIVTLQIESPAIVSANHLHGRDTLTQTDIATYLQPELNDAVVEWLGERTLQELRVNIATKDLFDEFLEARLKRTCKANGLDFLQLRTLNYHVIQLDALNQVREAYLIRSAALEAEVTGEERLFEQLTERDLQEIREQTRQVEKFERRSAVRQQMRSAILSDEFAEIRSEREKEAFLHDIDHERLLQGDEWSRIQREIAWQRNDDLRVRRESLQDHVWGRRTQIDDRDRERAHLLTRIDLENSFEQQSLSLSQRKQLEPEVLAHEQSVLRQRLEGQQSAEIQRTTFELAQMRQLSEFETEQHKRQAALDREQANLDQLAATERALRQSQADRRIALNKANTEAEIAQLRLDQESAEGELALLLYL